MPAVIPPFPTNTNNLGGAFYVESSSSGDPGPLTANPWQIPALQASTLASSSHPSALQVLSFSVPSSAEEVSHSFNPSPSWDTVMREIQTSTGGSAGLTGLGPPDGPGFPTTKALRMAWPSLLKKLGVVG
jgi:hypothetical protein